MPLLQDPSVVAEPGFAQQMESLGWVDRTALAVLAVFFAIGIFKGLIWQVSRIAILLAAYAASGRFGAEFGAWLARTPATGGSPGPEPIETPETTLYLAYVLLFLVVLVALSLLAMLLQKLAAQAGLSFFDRLGGGVVGVATGAGVVLFGLFVVNMFFRGSQLSAAAETSHALRLSRSAVDWFGETVPDDLRHVIALAPLRTPVDEGAAPLPGSNLAEPFPADPAAPDATPAPAPAGPGAGAEPPKAPKPPERPAPPR